MENMIAQAKLDHCIAVITQIVKAAVGFKIGDYFECDTCNKTASERGQVSHLDNCPIRKLQGLIDG